MTSEEKEELIRLLEERTLSNWKRRKRRLQSIPVEVIVEALKKERTGKPLTREQYIAANLGFLPGEIPGRPRFT
jgi:hypothetical protein